MDQATKPQDLLELMRELRMTVRSVERALGLGNNALYRGRYTNGRLTPAEIDTLAEVLRVDRVRVEDAVRETERRWLARKDGAA